MERYLEENGLRIEDLDHQKDEQVFRFGPGKGYESKELV